MRLINKFALVSFMALSLWLPRASALVDVSLVGGVSAAGQTVSNTSYTSSSYSIKPYLTFGALGNFKLPFGTWGITSGLMYTELGSHQEYAIGALYTADSDLKLPYIQIPVTLDYWFMNMFGAGLGFYYGLPAGSVSEKGSYTSLGVPYSVSRTRSFDEAGYVATDYGVLLHAQVKVPVDQFFLTGNVFYEIGLQDIAATDASTIRNYAFLVQVGAGMSF